MQYQWNPIHTERQCKQCNPCSGLLVMVGTTHPGFSRAFRPVIGPMLCQEATWPAFAPPHCWAFRVHDSFECFPAITNSCRSIFRVPSGPSQHDGRHQNHRADIFPSKATPLSAQGLQFNIAPTLTFLKGEASFIIYHLQK